MTLFSMRAALALLFAASLASCGGGSETSYPITGTVTGLYYDSLVLTTGSQSVTVKPAGVDSNGIANAVNYQFPQTLSYGDPFYVVLGTNPPHESCLVGQAAADSAGHTASIAIAVSCSVNQYTVNAYVHGLAAEGLQLINGSNNGVFTVTVATVTANAATEAAAKAAALAATPSSTSYTLTPSVAFPLVTYGQTYGISILTQPAGQTCTVTNGNGTMGDSAVYNVSVDCVTNPS